MKTTSNTLIPVETAKMLTEEFNSLNGWVIEEGFETITYRKGRFPDWSKSLIQSINQQFSSNLKEHNLKGKVSEKSNYGFDFDEILVLKGSNPHDFFPFFHTVEQEYTVCIPLNQKPIFLWEDYMDGHMRAWIDDRKIVLYDEECLAAQIRECSHSDDAYIILLRKNR